MSSYILKGIYIELLNACNLNCLHCYNNSGNNNSCIPLDVLIRVVKEAEDNKISMISLSGGEPLLYPHLFELLKYIQENTQLKVSIVTNGTLISKSLISKILSVISKNRFVFQISIDGATSCTNDYVRGIGSFDMLQSGIKVLEEIGIHFYFHMVLNKMNIGDFEQMIELALFYKHRVVDFSFLKVKGRAINNFSELFVEYGDMIEAIKEMNKLKQKKRDQITINCPSLFYGSCPLFTEDNQINVSIRIDSSGNVYPCQMFSCDQSALGNIFNTYSLSEIIQNIEKVSLKYRQRSKCSNCVAKTICSGGCPGTEWTEDLLSDVYKYSYECQLRIKHYKDLIQQIADSNK